MQEKFRVPLIRQKEPPSRFLAGLAALLMVGSPAAGWATVPAEELPAEAGLEELLRFAAENSPSLRASFEEWRAAVERVPQARSLPDPTLSYGYFLERMETRQTFSLAQVFPWFGVLTLREGLAGQVAKAAAARFEAEQRALFRDVKVAYAEWYYVEAAGDLARRHRSILQQHEEVALSRLRAGNGSDADVLRLRMELDRLEDEIAMRGTRSVALRAELNAILGRAGDAPLASPKQPAVDSARVEQWIERSAAALENHPRLRAATSEAERDRLNLDLAKKEGRPEMMLGVEVMDNTRMGDDEVMVMASITLPIWRERYAAARREARARLESGLATRDAVQRSLEAEVQRVLFHLDDARRKAALYSDRLLPRARQALASLEGAYRAGGADFLDLVDARRTLLDVELERQRAFADLFQQAAALEELVGAVGMDTNEEEN